jgi:hypothetical protein
MSLTADRLGTLRACSKPRMRLPGGLPPDAVGLRGRGGRPRVRVRELAGAPPNPPITCRTASSPSNRPSDTLSIRGQRS